MIGSGSKHLITRVIGGNKGFDYDYNLILNCEEGYHWKAKYARDEVYKALDKAFKGTAYDHPQNSKVAIRVKVKDKVNSRILHSCDFAVVYYPGDIEKGHCYAKLDLKTNECVWEMRKHTNGNPTKLNWLKENVKNYWSKIKKEYLILKDNNKDPNKHSYQLFYETVNNVYNENKL